MEALLLMAHQVGFIRKIAQDGVPVRQIKPHHQQEDDQRRRIQYGVRVRAGQYRVRQKRHDTAGRQHNARERSISIRGDEAK